MLLPLRLNLGAIRTIAGTAQVVVSANAYTTRITFTFGSASVAFRAIANSSRVNAISGTSTSVFQIVSVASGVFKLSGETTTVFQNIANATRTVALSTLTNVVVSNQSSLSSIHNLRAIAQIRTNASASAARIIAAEAEAFVSISSSVALSKIARPSSATEISVRAFGRSSRLTQLQSSSTVRTFVGGNLSFAANLYAESSISLAASAIIKRFAGLSSAAGRVTFVLNGRMTKNAFLSSYANIVFESTGNSSYIPGESSLEEEALRRQNNVFRRTGRRNGNGRPGKFEAISSPATVRIELLTVNSAQHFDRVGGISTVSEDPRTNLRVKACFSHLSISNSQEIPAITMERISSGYRSKLTERSKVEVVDFRIVKSDDSIPSILMEFVKDRAC